MAVNSKILNEITNPAEKAAFKNMRPDMATGKALLNPEQLGYFLKEATLDNTLLADADFTLMKSFKKQLNRTGINGRVLTNGYKANGDTDDEIAAADVDFGANELDAKKLKAMCEISDDEKEDNMTGEQFEQTLLGMMGERIGEDLEYWAVYGDTTIARADDALLNTTDGWLKKCVNKLESTGIDANDGAYDINDGPEAMFDAMIKALPARFRKNRSQLKFYVPFEVEDAYRNVLIARGTTLGDSAQTGFAPLTFKGIPVVHCATLDDETGRTLSGDVAHSILSNPKNLAYGIWRNLSIEPERKPGEELTKYWFRMRGDVDYYFRNGAVTAQITTTEVEGLPELSMG